MTQEQEQQIIGRLVKQYQEARKEHAFLRVELDSIGRNLMLIGQTLVSAPHELHVADQVNPLFVKIDEYAERLRTAMETERRASDQLKALGINVSDVSA